MLLVTVHKTVLTRTENYNKLKYLYMIRLYIRIMYLTHIHYYWNRHYFYITSYMFPYYFYFWAHVWFQKYSWILSAYYLYHYHNDGTHHIPYNRKNWPAPNIQPFLFVGWLPLYASMTFFDFLNYTVNPYQSGINKL